MQVDARMGARWRIGERQEMHVGEYEILTNELVFLHR